MDVSSIIMPLLRQIEPETAHQATILALKLGFGKANKEAENDSLSINVAGLPFKNPIGLAAGFDKNAEVIKPMLGLGFGFVETGTVTPLPQKGNPKPRVFRLPKDGAIINRLGFNNDGLDAYTKRLKARSPETGIVGANIGHNKNSTDPVDDYVICAQKVAAFCDYITINVSSPNTPGLRTLQNKTRLSYLIEAVLEAISDTDKPIFVKIAPDLLNEDRADIAEIATKSAIAGLIVSNTTIGRNDNLKSPAKVETGGLSGIPLFDPSTALLSEMYRRTQGKVALIGAGGIFSGRDAFDKICAGASLVQLYTGLIYQGPKIVRLIKDDLVNLLADGGFKSVSDAVGSQLK